MIQIIGLFCLIVLLMHFSVLVEKFETLESLRQTFVLIIPGRVIGG